MYFYYTVNNYGKIFNVVKVWPAFKQFCYIFFLVFVVVLLQTKHAAYPSVCYCVKCALDMVGGNTYSLFMYRIKYLGQKRFFISQQWVI